MFVFIFLFFFASHWSSLVQKSTIPTHSGGSPEWINSRQKKNNKSKRKKEKEKRRKMVMHEKKCMKGHDLCFVLYTLWMVSWNWIPNIVSIIVHSFPTTDYSTLAWVFHFVKKWSRWRKYCKREYIDECTWNNVNNEKRRKNEKAWWSFQTWYNRYPSSAKKSANQPPKAGIIV